MKIDLNKIVIIVGNYGSGKTEVAINLAVTQKRSGIDVCIADLDLVNPYFRTREVKGLLSGLGIDVITPPDEYLQADLPILSAAVSGAVRRPCQLTLLDVGGDGVGVRALAALADSLEGKNYNILQVVNPLRPFTDTVKGCLKMRSEIEKASKMTINGIIGNANMVDETTVEDIYEGYDFVKQLSKESRLPFKFVTVAVKLMPDIDVTRFYCPVLQIERQLVPPWKRSVSMKPLT